MRRESSEFAEFWNGYGVLDREGGERTFNHPRDGLLRYAQVTFDLAGRPDLKMTMLVPDGAGTPTGIPALAGGREPAGREPGRARPPDGKRALPHGRPGWPVRSLIRVKTGKARHGYFACITWPRISPPLLAAVCTFTYRLPASRSFICASVSVAVPCTGLVGLGPPIGTATPAFLPVPPGRGNVPLSPDR